MVRICWCLYVLLGTLPLSAQAREWRVLVESDENVNQMRACLNLGEKGAGVDENWRADRWREVLKIADEMIAANEKDADKKDHAGHAVKYMALLELKGDRKAATQAAVRATKDLSGNPKALAEFINRALYSKPTVSDYQLALVEGLCVTQVKGKEEAMRGLAPIARQALDKVLESHKKDLGIRMLEYQILYVLEGNKKKAHELGEKIIAEGQQQRSSLNSWLWQLMTMRATAGKYRPLCLQAARKLAQQNPSSYELDTIALALFENGLLEEALDFQKRAVGKGGASKGMMRRLKLFEEAMARKKAPTSRRTDGR